MQIHAPLQLYLCQNQQSPAVLVEDDADDSTCRSIAEDPDHQGNACLCIFYGSDGG
jgi:hypothetical protein